MSVKLTEDKIKELWGYYKDNKLKAGEIASKAGLNENTVRYYFESFDSNGFGDVISRRISPYTQRALRRLDRDNSYAKVARRAVKRIFAKKDKKERLLQKQLLLQKRRLYGKILTGILIRDKTEEMGYGGQRKMAARAGVTEFGISRYAGMQRLPKKHIEPKLLMVLGLSARTIDSILNQLPANINISKDKKTIESYLRAVLPDLGL